MSRENRDLGVARKIRDYCDGVTGAMHRFGKDIAALKSDIDYHDAVAMKLFMIGELSGHLSDHFKLSHPEVSWPVLKAMRNLAVYDADNFDFEYVWGAMNDDIPLVRKFFQRVVVSDDAGSADEMPGIPILEEINREVLAGAPMMEEHERAEY